MLDYTNELMLILRMPHDGDPLQVQMGGGGSGRRRSKKEALMFDAILGAQRS